jgi:type I restriction-modification system DNA methylase subunit
MNLLDHVLGIRFLIHRSFSGKLERLGIGLSQYEERDGLSSEDETLRQRIIDINNTHLKEKKGNFAEAREYTLRQCVFTLFNRLAAIKLMEQKQLFPEVIKQRTENGGLSAAHQAWLEENPAGRSMERDGLVLFFTNKFTELSEHIPVYREDYPYSMLPTADELNEIICAFNAIEEDTETATTWQGDDILGWLYENFNSAEKVEFKQSGAKVEYDRVSLQSQVYTPSWVVKFLVDNSLGKLYLEMYPESRIDAPDPVTGERRIMVANRPTKQVRPRKKMHEIRVIDPACGSGNFLLYAFLLLYEMYIDQIDNFGADYSKREVPALIIENNLFGVDLDERAVQMAQIGLLIKAWEVGGRRARKPHHTGVVCSGFYLPPYEEVEKVFGYDTSWTVKLNNAARKIWTDLSQAHKFGTLVRVEEQFNELAPQNENNSLFKAEEMQGLFDDRNQMKTQLHNLVKKYGEQNANPYTLLKMNEAMTFLDIISHYYDTVVANPPYTDSGDFGPELKAFVEENYRRPLKFNTNLYACFIKRCCELAGDDGIVGMVNPPTFMYIKTFEDLRKFMLNKTHISLFVEWGYLGMFASFARVDSAMFILDKETKSKGLSTFIKLNDLYEMKRKEILFKAYEDLCNNIPNDRVYTLPQSKLKGIKSYPFIYWISDEFREKFNGRILEDVVGTKKGLDTSCNERFLRFWWEIDSNTISEDYSQDKKKWVRYAKGGPFKKWYGNMWLTINWRNDGYDLKNFTDQNGKMIPTLRNQEFYFKEGITYSAAGSKGTTFRYLPSNCIIDSGGPGIYDVTGVNMDYVLALLNTKLTFYVCGCLNPTVNTTHGDLRRIPFADAKHDDEISIISLSRQNVAIMKYLSQYSLIEPLYQHSPITPNGNIISNITLFYNKENALLTLILLNESIINKIIFDVYELSDHDRKMVLDKEGIPIGDLPTSHEAKVAFRQWLMSESEFNPSSQILEHLDQLEEREDLPRISDFGVLYQTNKEWEEFCINHKMNPVEVWWQFHNAGILPPQRTQTLAFELITDIIRSLLAKDDDGVIPLVGYAGEQQLAPRIESELVQRGYSAAQIAQVFSLLSNGNLERYLHEHFFQQLSDHLNLFMYLPKTPFIWHITSGPHHALELFVSIYTWSRDTLMRIKSVYAANLEAALKDRLQVLLQGDATQKSEATEVRAQLKELSEFCGKVDQLLASGYNPKLDDGVGKNIAPLQKAGIISYTVLKDTQLDNFLNAEW